MEELTTTNNQLARPVSSEVTMLDIRRDKKKYPRIGTYPREQAVAEMVKIVSQAFLYRGQAVDSTNIQFISCALVDELQADTEHLHTRNISFAEIAKVVKKAVMTQDMYGISVASLYKIITDYIRTEGSKLQEMVDKEVLKKRNEDMRNSVIAPMLQAYAGGFAKTHREK